MNISENTRLLAARAERELKDIFAAIDEVSEKYGFPTAAIVTMSEVTEALDGTVITPELKAAIEAYYEQYGVKE